MQYIHRQIMIVLAVSISIAGAALAGVKKDRDEEVRSKTVRATMERVSGMGVGIRAKSNPGRFTIAKGETAYDFWYSFTDPKLDAYIHHKGPGNIYSVTNRKYVATAEYNPKFTLGEGEYKFFVGGTPGAHGTLSFKIRHQPKQESPDKPAAPPAGSRIIDTMTWLPEYENIKTNATYTINGNKVTGTIDQEYQGLRNKQLTCENNRNKGTFTGSINGNVITGTWQLENLPHRVVVHGRDGKDFGRRDWGTMKIDSVTTLKADGTLTETLKITGTSNSQWDANAPDAVAGKIQSNNYTANIPGEHVKGLMIGTWKERP